MSGFVGDTASTPLPWREQALEREPPPTISHQQHQHPQPLSQLNHHHQQLPHLQHLGQQHQQSHGNYERYSPSVGSEQEEGKYCSPNASLCTGTAREGDMSIGGINPSGDPRLSIGERRLEKRKNKRHRLTHNETRFLMSEFARQAHPDAAHRERLAREIPGLTPRQVQVWFQNRRAKLKRMSSDDRERMMKSRALPEEFPILQTLHTYSGRMVGATPLTSPTEFSPTNNPAFRSDPLVRRRGLGEEEVGVSPTGSQFAGLSFTPPTSSGEILSPVSGNAERQSYLPYMSTPLGPPQRGNPFSRPGDYRSPNVPRLQLHDTPRSLADAGGTPARTSPSYSNNPLDHGDYQLSPSYSLQTFVEPPRSVPPEGPYSQPYPSPGPGSAPPHRPSPFPSPLGLGEYKFPQAPMTPHSASASLSGFSSTPLTQNSEFQQLSTPADATTFNSSYLTRPPGNTFGSVTSMTNPQQTDEDRGRSVGKDIGHQRKRSSSHPPSFPQAPRAP